MEEKCAQCGAALTDENKCATDPTLCKECGPKAEGEAPAGEEKAAEGEAPAAETPAEEK